MVKLGVRRVIFGVLGAAALAGCGISYRDGVIDKRFSVVKPEDPTPFLKMAPASEDSCRIPTFQLDRSLLPDAVGSNVKLYARVRSITSSSEGAALPSGFHLVLGLSGSSPSQNFRDFCVKANPSQPPSQLFLAQTVYVLDLELRSAAAPEEVLLSIPAAKSFFFAPPADGIPTWSFEFPASAPVTLQVNDLLNISSMPRPGFSVQLRINCPFPAQVHADISPDNSTPLGGNRKTTGTGNSAAIPFNGFPIGAEGTQNLSLQIKAVCEDQLTWVKRTAPIAEGYDFKRPDFCVDKEDPGCDQNLAIQLLQEQVKNSGFQVDLRCSEEGFFSLKNGDGSGEPLASMDCGAPGMGALWAGATLVLSETLIPGAPPGSDPLKLQLEFEDLAGNKRKRDLLIQY